MNKLLIQHSLNVHISKEEFVEDINCLFQNMKELYGMYEYYGNHVFDNAYNEIINTINNRSNFRFYESVEVIKQELAFIRDGHFHIGEHKEITSKYDYAIRYSNYKGIPVIECKKFYCDTNSDKEQLEEFAGKGIAYRNNFPLILDFRGNVGGSTTYVYDFLCSLLDNDKLGYTYKYVQRYSQLFRDWLDKEKIDWDFDESEEVVEESSPIIPNSKKIFVLIDEKTASAAEEAIAFLKNIENATIVGNKTAGCYSCGNCIDFYLPNSHLKVFFGTGMLLYNGITNVDAEGGFKADISYEEFERIFID